VQHSFLEGTLPLDCTTYNISGCKGRSGIAHTDFKPNTVPERFLLKDSVV